MAEKKDEDIIVLPDSDTEGLSSNAPQVGYRTPLADPYDGTRPGSAPMQSATDISDPWAAKTEIPAPAPTAPDVVSGGMTGNNVAVYNRDYPQTPNQIPQAAMTPPGALKSSPSQGTADYLTSLQRQGQNNQQIANAEVSQNDQMAVAQRAAAAEAQQYNLDLKRAREAEESKYQERSKRREEIFNKYQKAAGSLKDPEDQYWEDKGVGGHVLGVLAAAFSGFGQSLTGQGGNAALDYIQKNIKNNYDAHRQNIQDLYQASVEAGHIQDTADTHAKFMRDAMHEEQELGVMHWNKELETIKTSTTSPIIKAKAAQTQEQLSQSAIIAREKLFDEEARKAAAAGAVDRARNEKALKFFQEQYKLHIEDGDDPGKASELAAKDASVAYPGGATGAMIDGLVQQAKTNQANRPAPGPSSPEFDENGDVITGAIDPSTGRRWKDGAKDKYVANAKKNRDASNTYENTLSSIDAAIDNVDKIAPSLINGTPGTDHQKRVLDQEEYNNLAVTAGEQIYRKETGINRTPPKGVIKEIMKPYLIPDGAYVSEEAMRARIEGLKDRYKKALGSTEKEEGKTPSAADVAKKLGVTGQ